MTGGEFVGIDIGGTVLSAALVDGSGQIVALRRTATPRSAGAEACLPELDNAVRNLLSEACGSGRLLAVGIGFGGPVDPISGVVRRSHHVVGWSGVPLREHFAELTGLPAYVENDANAAAIAEAMFGAARDAEVVLYVNVGTGIGGGIAVRKRIYRGAHFNAGEIGHIPLLPDDGPPCPCGKRGCLEALASGDAIGREAQLMSRQGKLRGSMLEAAPALTGRTVGEYAVQGDEVARAIVARAGGYLGWGLAIAVNILDPDIVVVGGG
ncbi:MAG: ROK family protein, partial [Armatimonadetes bacterium]|nr:ROK family protein [Armatimonadota bacterium]